MNNPNNDLILKIENLSVEYRTEDATVYALNDLSLELKKGKTLGLVGETGAGKTTTALAIMRLLPDPPAKITSGTISFFNTDVLGMNKVELSHLRGKKISMIFQDPMTSLNPVIPVEEQIAEVIRIQEGVSEKEALNRACDMLEMVGIVRSRGKEYPHQFSGGMKQRVVIAMALACNPQLLIADEPTTALDVTIQAQVLEKIHELKEKLGTSMLMITHDLGVIAETCDTVAIIYAGRVVEYGLAEDIFENHLHPYTRGLFESLPNLSDRKARLKPIKGLMPDPSDLPSGCPFWPRCKYATEKCRQELPQKQYRNENHYVVCHLYNEENIMIGGIL